MATNNSICHYDIPTTDFEKSKTFYEGLFGWKVQLMPEMNYALFMIEGGVGGGFMMTDNVKTEGIQVYIQVEDLTATLDMAESLGGKIVKPKAEIGGDNGFYGFFVV